MRALASLFLERRTAMGSDGATLFCPTKWKGISGIQLHSKQERRIDDYRVIDGSKDLSDSWTGFTQFTPSEEKIQTNT